MLNRDRRGMLVFMVIGIIMVVVIFSMIALRIVANHSRLNYHQVSRIQALYAAKAGVIYALDKLRKNDDSLWPACGNYQKTMCRSGCNINEYSLPTAIQYAVISVGDPGSGVSGIRKVSCEAIYSYNESVASITPPILSSPSPCSSLPPVPPVPPPVPPVPPPVPPVPPPPTEVACFVATATMGDKMHPFVLILKDFRDKYLTQTSSGRAFINYYYAHSPYFASLIRNNKILRFFSFSLIVYPSVQLAKFLLNRRQ